jgi:hypothetical protein
MQSGHPMMGGGNMGGYGYPGMGGYGYPGMGGLFSMIQPQRMPQYAPQYMPKYSQSQMAYDPYGSGALPPQPEPATATADIVNAFTANPQQQNQFATDSVNRGY